MLKKIAGPVLCVAVGILSIVSATPQKVVEETSPLVAKCMADYKETYLKERPFRKDVRVRYEYVTLEEVRNSPFVRWLRKPLDEPVYVSITICNLPPRFLGGEGHYLLSPESGEIIARYHTK